MLKQVTDMETWLLDNADDRIYRYLIYRRLFTPYEQQQAFVDESEYEDVHYNFGLIEEVVDIGNGDWLIGFRKIYDDGDISGEVEYCRLSEIRLCYFEQDQNMLTANEEIEDEDDE